MRDILEPHADATLHVLKQLQTSIATALADITKAIDDARATFAANDVAVQGAMSARLDQVASVFNGGDGAKGSMPNRLTQPGETSMGV